MSLIKHGEYLPEVLSLFTTTTTNIMQELSENYCFQNNQLLILVLYVQYHFWGIISTHGNKNSVTDVTAE